VGQVIAGRPGARLSLAVPYLLARQRDHAQDHGQHERANLFKNLIDRIDQAVISKKAVAMSRTSSSRLAGD
jgi:hypothetical protein